MRSALVDDGVCKFTNNITDVFLEQAELKISIDDLQVMQAIVFVTLAEINEMSAVWMDYSSGKVKEQAVAPRPKLLEIQEEVKAPVEPNLYSMVVRVNKANILIINET